MAGGFMKKLFEKHETLFCILLIVLYILTNSFCVQNFGYTSWVGFVVNTALSALLLALMFALNRTAYYGLTKAENGKKFLYFLPLALILTVNLWNGINLRNSPREILFHILTMLNIGFIEEVIFRGFLFKMMAKDNVKAAIIVSSLTFGIGHILNLLNGAELIPTLLQICYAVAIGYLFVLIFHKSKSLIPCIITHSVMNSLSIFNVENSRLQYVSAGFLIVVPLVYAFYIRKRIKE